MEKTKSGISLIQLFFVFGIISDLIILSGVQGLLSEPEVNRTSVQTFGSTMCIGFIFSLIGFGILVYGIYKVHQDVSSFPSSHEDNVTLAIGCYVFGFIGGLLYTPIETFLFAIGTVLLIKEIAPAFEKKLLWSAAGVKFLTAIGFVILFSIGLERDVILTVLRHQVYWIVISTITGSLLFIIAYRRVNEQLSEQLEFSSVQDQDSSSESREGYVGSEKPDRCPRCGERSLKVKEGRFLSCSECSYLEEVKEGNDEETRG